ncbi:D-alanyl-D-alanine carboxypeptidase family protein [Litchfieldia salsa]|uniref:D-alanyl-D-alanine carboxypeptidase/D-alanyl-D-alanine carboxypeptidase (Penicillin-binding protein 5/6) n=1 Tax=Litchfieldia salsa TaxID=930152 RepID=A0A1H0WQ91_9BACI|nr:D-alanyl-D-alanine carboxypeptidase family protein [Litchfieldia salsa]SDP92436.1 D-alanyl-D-alanine carboxypeptidase/D-alanyl-D-alanine carboxypeptidase (penicillin-binding protein 5/6) [Litchfieldia salsa]
MKTPTIIILIVIFTLLLPSQALGQFETIDDPEIQSEAAILIDATTGEVLFEQNSDDKMYPASITKIVTAILAIESNRLDELVTVSKRAREADGTRVYLEEGEVVPLKKLVQGLMINSGNDAGIAIAEHLGGSVEEFAVLMNRFVKNKIGVKDTHFENPHGLFDDEHYSTAANFAEIMKYAVKNETFREVIATAELRWVGESWDTTIFNHHWMLREWPYEGVIGGKNGYIDQSGHTLVTAAVRENLSLITVVLKATTKRMMYNDTEKLFDYGFTHFETAKLPPQEFTNEENVKYRLEDPFFYTKKIGEETKLAIGTSGELTITGEDERVIASEQLINPLEMVDKSRLVKSTNPLDASYKNKATITSKGLIMSAIVIFLIGTFFYLRKRNKEKRFFQ